MIIHSFDTTTESVTTFEACFGERGHMADICIMTYSNEIYEHVLSKFDCEQISNLRSCAGVRPIYAFRHGGRRIAFILAGIGSTAAGNDVEEVHYKTGAEKFIAFGSAGSLDGAATTGKYLVPTEAYRDEGLSYHYAPPADFIRLRGSDRVAEILRELKMPVVEGRVWTTDAFYRETKKLVEQHRREGCLAVEMESAGVQAVCDFRGLEFYCFLVTGDVLDAPVYKTEGLSSANHSLDKFYLALEIAARI